MLCRQSRLLCPFATDLRASSCLYLCSRVDCSNRIFPHAVMQIARNSMGFSLARSCAAMSGEMRTKGKQSAIKRNSFNKALAQAVSMTSFTSAWSRLDAFGPIVWAVIEARGQGVQLFYIQRFLATFDRVLTHKQAFTTYRRGLVIF